jgi:hypothetical protein
VVNATPRPLYPRESPGTDYIGGWLGPGAGLDRCGKSRPHWDSIPKPSSLQRVAIPTELSRTYGKDAGPDNIPADILLPLFQGEWQKEKFAKEWKEGIIIEVLKKGDLSQCRNWRGITLLVVISNIFIIIIIIIITIISIIVIININIKGWAI